MACQDVSGTAHPADFDWFEYREREYQRYSAASVDPMGSGFNYTEAGNASGT
jgi:hypothetical protein